MISVELIAIDKISRMLNVSDVEAKALVKQKDFPKVHDTYNSVIYWKKSDVDEYIAMKNKEAIKKKSTEYTGE